MTMAPLLCFVLDRYEDHFVRESSVVAQWGPSSSSPTTALLLIISVVELLPMASSRWTTSFAAHGASAALSTPITSKNRRPAALAPLRHQGPAETEAFQGQTLSQTYTFPTGACLTQPRGRQRDIYMSSAGTLSAGRSPRHRGLFRFEMDPADRPLTMLGLVSRLLILGL